MEAWLSRLPKGELLSRCNLGGVGLGEFAGDSDLRTPIM